MRAVVQRVVGAGVAIGGEPIAGFEGPGVLVLLGVTHSDGPAQVTWLARKVAGLRIMRGERSISDLGAPALVVSQFTLYGDARKGRRPTWQDAAPGPVAEPLYEAFCSALSDLGTPVHRGRFGADMAVSLVNDGPVTLCLETPRPDPGVSTLRRRSLRSLLRTGVGRGWPGSRRRSLGLAARPPG